MADTNLSKACDVMWNPRIEFSFLNWEHNCDNENKNMNKDRR